VEIPQASSEAGVDTAGVKILCQDRGKTDGSDYRVLDSSGKPVPFQLMFHDAPRYSLISFRATDPRHRYFIYFGNPNAQRASEEVVVDPAPGAGPPKGSWIPRYGLVYTTLQRPEGPNPKTVPEMAKLVAGSRAKHGARYQRKISDGYNPFGSSDYYISIYRGWIQIPKAGKYQFCTISNEASFSFLDGKELVHWPGRHTVERGIHGEKNAAVELAAGLHYIEYYHEEVTLEQMAFLGWRPSADQGPFSPIPESVYSAPHHAVVARYELSPTAHAMPRFEPVILDTIWPAGRHEGQYTRCRFRAFAPGFPGDSTCQWSFGDGTTATGPEVEHIYLAPGRYQVVLRTGGNWLSPIFWPLEIYEMQHVTDEIKEGRLADYAKLARTYDRRFLDAAGFQELAYLLAESGDPAEAIQVGRQFLDRFGASQPERVPRVHRLIAECMLRLGSNVDQAIENFRASITKETPLAEKLDVYARLIQLVGIERDLPQKTDEILGQAEADRKAAPLDAESQAAYRRVVIAAGDVKLWHAKPDDAREFYKRAEVLSGRFMPPQVRAARVGAFPNSIREFLVAGDYRAALDVVNRWDETFPTEKIHGQTFFWRGKLLTLSEQPKDAARYLARAVGLAVGADFESEARWLLAQSLEKLGRSEDARKELAKLVASGITDPFTKMARERLAEQAKKGDRQ
jgi:tetratricopeptide (TPR) repeat protein